MPDDPGGEPLDGLKGNVMDYDVKPAFGEIDSLLAAAETSIEKSQNGDVLSDILYHYCDGNALKSIIERKQLWATHWEYLNDSQEFRHGVKLFKNALTAKRDVEQVPKWKWIFDWIVNRMDGRWSDDHYVCCFSRGGDKLSQWRGYAGNGSGYAIGFDRRLIVERCNFDGEWRKRDVFSVIYDDQTKAGFVRQIIDTIVDVLSREFSVEAIEGNQKLQNDIVHNIYVRMFKYSIRLKEMGFHEESELRYSVKLPTEGDHSNIEGIKMRERRGLLVPYLEIGTQDDLLPIRRIVMGPCLDHEKAERSLRVLLKQKKYPDSLTIDKSTVPFLT